MRYIRPSIRGLIRVLQAIRFYLCVRVRAYVCFYALCATSDKRQQQPIPIFNAAFDVSGLGLVGAGAVDHIDALEKNKRQERDTKRKDKRKVWQNL